MRETYFFPIIGRIDKIEEWNMDTEETRVIRQHGESIMDDHPVVTDHKDRHKKDRRLRKKMAFRKYLKWVFINFNLNEEYKIFKGNRKNIQTFGADEFQMHHHLQVPTLKFVSFLQ